MTLKFKVGDKAIIPCTVVNVDDIEIPYRVRLNDGDVTWANEDQLLHADAPHAPLGLDKEPCEEPQPAPLDYAAKVAEMNVKAKRADYLNAKIDALKAIDPFGLVICIDEHSKYAPISCLCPHPDIVREGVRVLREQAERELREILGEKP